LEKFVALYDLHWGYERRGGHKIPLHDQKALNIALEFIKDYKPDHIILGGDILDCGCISHHNHGKPGAIEGLKLLGDAKELRDALIVPLEKTGAKLTYIVGNHEDWLTDLVDQIPALEGIVDVRSLLKLNDSWKVVPNGEIAKLGKLVFVHGDQIKGGENSAKWASIAYEKNSRFGHFHTAQLYSKVSPVYEHGHTAVCVPCLCKKNPNYGGQSPNRWQQGFLWGYVNGPGGLFNDYLTIITHGQAIINGKVYKG
jgi:metallophosphoesterase superfamily enzyme